MKFVKIPCLVICALVVLGRFSMGLAASVLEGKGSAEALIQRVLPKQADQFVFEIILAAEGGADVFEVEAVNGKIVLRGNSALSLASALNFYLQNVAFLEVGHDAGNLAALDGTDGKKLPLPGEKIRREATVPFRMTYNYCTFGYTMPWWDWERWEKEIDFLALNGINRPFIITGQEAVWIETFRQYGCTEEEIRHWLGSPAHFPWLFMQNMEDFGGTLPEAWVKARVALGQKILARCRELGMQPILQGYYGMLPSTFAKHNPGAKILPQGVWCGFRRPDMLDPTDPLFEKIAHTFLVEQERLFGRAGYYAADPFHEGGNRNGVDMADCGERIFHAMKSVDPDAVWVKQCWQDTNEELLSRVPLERVVTMDLNSESCPFWENGNFSKRRWTWNLLQNFGGNTDLGGDLPALSHLFPDALQSPKKGNLYGMGCLPEGWHSTPAVWALQLEFVWRNEPFQMEEWLGNYTHRRYGKESAEMNAAWKNLVGSVYGISYKNAQSPANAIFQARPMRGKAREWSTTKQVHDPVKVLAAWDAFLAEAKRGPGTDGFAFDYADVARQSLADATNELAQRIEKAWLTKDLAAFEKYSGAFSDVVKDLDAVLATRPEFLLGRWISDARKWGTNETEKDLFEKQARTLITLWDGKPGKSLNDYACRQWQGLVKDFYMPRWELYFQMKKQFLTDSTPFDPEIFRKQVFEKELSWTEAHQSYTTEPEGNLYELLPKLRAKYAPLFDEIYVRNNPQR